MSSLTLRLTACTAAFLLLAFAGRVGAAELRVIAPSAPGSAWDQFAQAASTALASTPGAPAIRIVNLPGGAGTVGLSQFVASADRDSLLVTGLAMMEAVVANRLPVSFDQLTPVGRLTAEPFVLVVPASSPIRTVGDLTAAMRSDPAKVSWAGGPGRGLDHAAAILFVRALGLDAGSVNFVPFITSAEAAGAVAEDRVTAALLPATEVETEVKAGRIRPLATSAAEPARPGDTPTLSEIGVPMQFVNWRGLAAQGGISRADRDRLERVVATVAGSPAWKDFLARKGWTDAYLGADAFGRFLQAEQARLYAALKAAGLIKRAD